MLVLRSFPVFALSVGLLAAPARAQQPPSTAKADAAPSKPAGASSGASQSAAGTPAASGAAQTQTPPGTKPTSPAAGTAAPSATGALPPAAGSAAAHAGASAAPAKPATPPPSPAQVQKARELWYRGVDAFRNGRYEEARQAFAECYALMPKSDVLRNLSISEVQSGHYVSAARHLSQLLTSADLPANVREEATRRLEQAEAQIGKLNFSVDVPGAAVNIDGAAIGHTPLDGAWYIEPGQHEIVVSKPGYPQEARQIYALAGVAIPVTVSLESLRIEQERDAHAAELMGTSEGETPRDHGIGTAATITLITTGTLTAAGVIAGVVFTAAADRHDSKAEELDRKLAGPGSCGANTQLIADCQEFWKERSDGHDDRQRAVVSFVGAGVAAAATLGYGLYLLLEDDSEQTKPKLSRPLDSLQPGLALSSRGASFSLQGHF